MRTAIIILVGALLFTACNNQTADKPPVVVKGQTLTVLPVSPEKVKGTYTGDFKGSPIAITLNYVSDNRASGYNVHKGLTRNISGTIEAKANGLHLQLDEPGNNQYDGKFTLLIDTVKWTGKGEWKPFKKGEAASFTLKKKAALPDEQQFGTTYIDSLQNYITLKPDGSCSYSYLTDTTNTGQQITVRGNYTKEKSLVTIFWQKNEVFPPKSVFKLTEIKPDKESDFIEKSLRGEGRIFTELWN